MSETPETDAEEYCLEPYPHYVKSSFARRLERERNEALESLSSVRKEIITAANHGAKENAKVNQWLCTKLASAVRERDEAKSELAETISCIEQAIDFHQVHGQSIQASAIKNLLENINQRRKHDPI